MSESPPNIDAKISAQLSHYCDLSKMTPWRGLFATQVETIRLCHRGWLRSGDGPGVALDQTEMMPTEMMPNVPEISGRTPQWSLRRCMSFSLNTLSGFLFQELRPIKGNARGPCRYARVGQITTTTPTRVATRISILSFRLSTNPLSHFATRSVPRTCFFELSCCHSSQLVTLRIRAVVRTSVAGK